MKPNQIAAVAAVTLALASPAAAGELDVSLGLDGSASEWDENIAGTALEVGWAFYPWLQLTFLGRTSYAEVDERVLTFLAVGVEAHHTIGPVRPFVRGGIVHQHEEPVSAYEHQPFQSLLGVGDGIRHRGGVDLAAGLEVPVYRFAEGDLYGAAQLDTVWFPDPRGPGWYVAAGLAFGVRWDFARPAPTRRAAVARAR